MTPRDKKLHTLMLHIVDTSGETCIDLKPISYQDALIVAQDYCDHAQCDIKLIAKLGSGYQILDYFEPDTDCQLVKVYNYNGDLATGRYEDENISEVEFFANNIDRYVGEFRSLETAQRVIDAIKEKE